MSLDTGGIGEKGVLEKKVRDNTSVNVTASKLQRTSIEGLSPLA